MGDDRGSELIELALVLPILLIICAAIMDFGFLFQRYEVVTNAAREGARLASLPGYSATDVQGRVNDYFTSSGLPVPPTPAVVTPLTSTIGGTTVDLVDVTVFYPSQFSFLGSLAGLVGGGGWTSITLRGSSTMRSEAPAAGS